MSRKITYKFNPDTLQYEVAKTPISKRFFKVCTYFVSGLVLFVCYMYLFGEVLGIEPPKTAILKKQNAEWHGKLELLSQRYDKGNASLLELQMRDNGVYRPIFGMEELSSDLRSAGFGGIDRYSFLELYDSSGELASVSAKLDILSKRAYVQLKSFEDVSSLAHRSEEMSKCIPSIPPVVLDERVRLSSRFGMRNDPFTKKPRFHSGVDLSCGVSGEPIYATGDGVVSRISFDFFGYGNYIIVDHGFGYKTRYAHLKATLVTEGQKVKKGDQIGEMGNTGRSKGTHLHYEVHYQNKAVNPLNYYNSDITPEEYAMMVKPVKPRG